MNDPPVRRHPPTLCPKRLIPTGLCARAFPLLPAQAQGRVGVLGGGGMLLHLPSRTSAVGIPLACSGLDRRPLLTIAHSLLPPGVGVGDCLLEFLFHDYFFFLVVFLLSLKAFSVGAPFDPGFLIFSPEPDSILALFAWMFAYSPFLVAIIRKEYRPRAGAGIHCSWPCREA